MALSLADLLGTLGCAVVVKGVAVHILALGEDTTAALSGLCSPSALTRRLCPLGSAGWHRLNPSYYQEKGMKIL